MGIMIGRCKRCGRLLREPSPSGVCSLCKKKMNDYGRKPDDIPDPLKY